MRRNDDDGVFLCISLSLSLSLSLWVRLYTSLVCVCVCVCVCGGVCGGGREKQKTSYAGSDAFMFVLMEGYVRTHMGSERYLLKLQI